MFVLFYLFICLHRCYIALCACAMCICIYLYIVYDLPFLQLFSRKKSHWFVLVCEQKSRNELCRYAQKIWNIKRNVMVEHSMQKSHIRQINDKECAPFHTECALHVAHKNKRICSNVRTNTNKAYHILWFVYDVPCYFIVGCCCLPLDWLSPLLLCNRFVRIHHAIFSSSFSLVLFFSGTCFYFIVCVDAQK